MYKKYLIFQLFLKLKHFADCLNPITFD